MGSEPDSPDSVQSRIGGDLSLAAGWGSTCRDPQTVSLASSDITERTFLSQTDPTNNGSRKRFLFIDLLEVRHHRPEPGIPLRPQQPGFGEPHLDRLRGRSSAPGCVCVDLMEFQDLAPHKT